jgi:hypothetical protein
MPTLADLDKRYDVDLDCRQTRRELLEFGRQWKE